MTYQQLLKELYNLSPQGIKFGLERVEFASKLLGKPQNNFKSIQVAGTNGKGTVCAMLEASFRKTGLKTGLFTSPHLHRFTERIKIDGREVEQNILATQLDKVLTLTRTNPENMVSSNSYSEQKNVDSAFIDSNTHCVSDKQPKVALSFFEIATLAALLVFKEQKVDIAIIEVGLGGRLDSTSIINPAISIITSIGLDHTTLLGDSIEKIAYEKASIARKEIPLICGNLPDPAKKVAKDIALKNETQATFLFDDYALDKSLISGIPGTHIIENASVAKQAFQTFFKSGQKVIEPDFFSRSIADLKVAGRFETIEGKFLLDGAHNIQAVNAMISCIKDNNIKIDSIIFGSLKDKPYLEMIEKLKTVSKNITLTSPPIERRFDGKKIAKVQNLSYEESIEQAIKHAPVHAGLTLITGSFFTIAKARQIILNEPTDPFIGL